MPPVDNRSVSGTVRSFDVSIDQPPSGLIDIQNRRSGMIGTYLSFFDIRK